MLLCWFLIALAIAPIAGEEECFVPGTSYNARAKRCICGPNTAGDPDFCCYDPEKETACIMKADPQVTSFDNFKVGMHVPCTSGFCQLKGPYQMNGNIFVAPIEIEGGRMYPSRAMINLRSGAHFLKLELDPESPNGYIASSFRYKQQVAYSNKYNFYTIRIENKLSITARLVKNTNVEQPRVPGICIVKPKNVIVSSTSYCGLSQNITLMKPDDKSNARTQPWKSLGNVEKINNPKYNEKCEDFGKWTQKCSMHKLSRCSVIVYDPKVRECLYHEQKGEMRLITSLNRCLSAVCGSISAHDCEMSMNGDPGFRKCLLKPASLCV